MCKQTTAYDMRISDWSSDVCSSDLLGDERQRLWTYFRLWPNIAFDIYPDQVDFMQWLPLSPTRSLIREVAYAIPDERREMKAARYLNWRINRRVNAEDRALLEQIGRAHV